MMVRETVGGLLAQRRGERQGTDNPHRLAVVQFIGVGDTDAEAYKLYKRAGRVLLQPVAARLRRLHGSARLRDRGIGASAVQVRRCARSPARKQQKHDLTWDEMVEKGYVVIGGPDTVRETLEEAARRRSTCGHLLTMLHFGNMSDELTRYNTKLFGDKVAPALRTIFADVRRPVVARERDGRLMAGERDLLYLFGIAGHPAPSPLIAHLEAEGSTSSFLASRGSTRAGTSSHPTTTSAGSRSCGTRSTRAACGFRAPSSARRSVACSQSTSPRIAPRP